MKKRMKKMTNLLAVGAAVMLVPAIGAQAEVNTVEGASFTQVTDVADIEGSCFYLYVPSNMEAPYTMVTPVIYVYGNEPYVDEDAAWEALTAAGLDTIAEDEKSAIIMVNPVGEEWSGQDIGVYEAIMSYISGNDGTVPLTYHNLQYAIGEGSGATFINNYLSLHCKRLAGVMTFGGEIGDSCPVFALPAYIVSGSQEAVDYYMYANDETKTLPISGRTADFRGNVEDGVLAQSIKAQWVEEDTEDKTIYTFAPDDVKKVIVSKEESETLDADLIADCWNTLFRYTTRHCLTANFWEFSSNQYNDAEYTLLKRPNYEEAGMDVVRVDGIGNGVWEDDETKYRYEFVPAAVQDAMESGSDETFPLLLCMTGSDHPTYDAESLGNYDYDVDLPICVVGGAYETESTDHNYHYVYADAIQTICELDELEPYEGEQDYQRYPYWGFPIEDQIRNEVPCGEAIWQGYKTDENGVPLLCLVHTETTTHIHYSGYANVIWSWMKQFSRDTETGAVIYTPAE